jgi:predicted DNA binding CopG/RHH family protein
MPNQMLKQIPKFKNEDEERKFWANHDSTEYLDWSKAKQLRLPRLRPSVRSISLRLPEGLLERIKLLANRNDIPYQSLMKVYLSERVEKEIGSKHVIPTDCQWGAHGEGNSRIALVHENQSEAFEAAKDIPKKQQSTLSAHDKHGPIKGRKGYGKAPYPPH